MKPLTLRRLGKHAPRIDSRTLKFAKYLTPLPVVPNSADWTLRVPAWLMYGNDQLGDCVEAAGAHTIQLWNSLNNPALPPIPEPTVIGWYSKVAGYVPGDPDTDNGTDMLSFLKFLRKWGYIAAYVALSPGSLSQMRMAVWLFGAAFVGVQLPITAQNQTAWTVPGSLQGDGAPGSWGGHCIPVGAYNTIQLPRNRNTVITWGETLQMSDYFYQSYNDEAYAILGPEWFKLGVAPNGFNLAALQADLAAL